MLLHHFLVKIFLSFKTSEISLPCPWETVTGLYPETQSNLHNHSTLSPSTSRPPQCPPFRCYESVFGDESCGQALVLASPEKAEILCHCWIQHIAYFHGVQTAMKTTCHWGRLLFSAILDHDADSEANSFHWLPLTYSSSSRVND